MPDMTLLAAYQAYVESLDAIDGEAERLDAIINLGRRHHAQAFPDAWKTDANQMHGCMSKVWIVHQRQDGRHTFHGHSDSLIVNGLVAVMTESFSGLTRAELAALTLDHVRRFRLGALTAQRQVGMMAMLKHFQRLAKAPLSSA
ncbi:MAG: SufE family protein [Rhodospirillales bacterium]|nr:SufE family protein [Rhodospirillales bacterium]